MMSATSDFDRDGCVLLRQARLVAVGSAADEPGAQPGPSEASPPRPVDVLVRGGRVTQIGVGLPRQGAAVLEADGSWLLPGLWDQHVHSIQTAAQRARIDTSGTDGPLAALARVRDHLAALAARGDEDSVVVGFGHRSATWAQPATVADLDASSGAHPVVLISGDAHHGWMNSAALSLLGLSSRPDPVAEAEWFAVFPAVADLPGVAAAQEAELAGLVRDAHARGVVGWTDMEFEIGPWAWPRRFAAGVDTLRVRASVYPESLETAIDAGWRTGDPLPGTGGVATMGPLKIISDGSLNTRTAYCCQRYVDVAPDPADPEAGRGVCNHPPEQLRGLLERATRHGLTVAVHAIGDAAISQALDAFAATGAKGSIEHAQLMSWADVDRMARLGITASVQPAHLLDDRDVTGMCWSDREDRCFPYRSLLRAGVDVRLGSDAPVAPLDPWLAMAAAVHRSGDDRPAWHPEQALSVAEALAASTDGWGTVDVGHPGDLVLLEADPHSPAGEPAREAADRLRAVRPLATMVAGRVVHQR